MNILLIEDDFSKERAISNLIDSTFTNVQITSAHSAMSGKHALKNDFFECVLLDMSLPQYDTNDIRYSHMDSHPFDPFGGISVLDEIDRLGLKCKAIIITAYDVIGEGVNKKDFDTLTVELKHDFPQIVIDSVYYNASSSSWMMILTELLKEIGGKQIEISDS